MTFREKLWVDLGGSEDLGKLQHQTLDYLAPVEYIERELAKIHSPVLPMWSARTHRRITFFMRCGHFCVWRYTSCEREIVG
ncbi:hypothetical protein, partial [Candidatus Hakubella thermalkaliphila]